LDQNNEDIPETETLDSAKQTLNACSKSKVCSSSSSSSTLLLFQIFLYKNVVFLLHPGLVCCSQQVKVALESVFWTFVDMASGRYLWKQLVQSPSKK
jgi:hypothetical protein